MSPCNDLAQPCLLSHFLPRPSSPISDCDSGTLGSSGHLHMLYLRSPTWPGLSEIREDKGNPFHGNVTFVRRCIVHMKTSASA